ncbi:hypothetical protein B0O80DRAFT_7868 [Mortierella sp. GBAus27b]|nr:hypothetical protein B0O80DRAFT_7868 [Mortierella sp. GBAus27b]
MIIANAVLRITGYPHFTRRISPHVSPSSTHTLHLDAIGLYEVLCPKAAGHFDVLDTDRNLLTNVANVRANKEAIFGAFFNTDKMQQLSRQHGLNFADRVSFVDRFTVRIMGEVIQQGPDRINGPVESQYEARKKNKKARAAMFNWGEEAMLRGMDKEEISRRCRWSSLRSSVYVWIRWNRSWFPHPWHGKTGRHQDQKTTHEVRSCGAHQ